MKKKKNGKRRKETAFTFAGWPPPLFLSRGRAHAQSAPHATRAGSRAITHARAMTPTIPEQQQKPRTLEEVRGGKGERR